MRITVVGIGQTLRGDDAAGIEAVRMWESLYPATAGRTDVTVQHSELPGLALLDLMEGYDGALLVDAVQTKEEPGTVFRLNESELESFGSGSRSAHGWGVAETLELDRRVNASSRHTRIRIIGIAVQQVQLGQPLSEAVKSALPAVCDAIEAEVQSLLSL